MLLAVENARPGRRGRFGSVPQIGLGLGLALGTGVFALLGRALDPQTFQTIGWRVAFLFSIVLVVIGLLVRLRVLETAEFAALRERNGTVSVPVAHVFRTRGHRRGLLAGMLARWAEGAAFNTWGVFIITYATVTAKVDKVVVLLGVTFGALLMAALTPVAGRLADRFGRRRVFGTGVLGFGLTVVPSLLAVRSGSVALTVFALLLQLGIWYALMTGAESTLFAELFDADVRYTGMSLVFQFSGIWASGLSPVILTALIAFGGGTLWWAGGHLVLAALISLIAVATMPRFIGWRPSWAADARW